MRFHEEQRFSGGWLWFWAGVVMLPVVIIAVILLIDVAVTGKDLTRILPVLAIMAVIDLVLAALLLALVRQPLTVRVTDESVTITFPPFVRETIPAADIVAVEEVPAGLFRQYGSGIGKRYGPLRARFAVGSDAGVVLERTNGWRYVLGSQRPAGLATAIQELIAAQTSGVDD